MNLTFLVSGILFGIGLVMSGMTNPQKVIGFLDVFGSWDYALVFVMGGAVFFNLVSFKFIKKLNRPKLGSSFSWPTKKDIDKNLIIGSALFGIGWGISGICPGPGIVNLVTLDLKALVFVVFLFIGIYIFKMVKSAFNL